MLLESRWELQRPPTLSASGHPACIRKTKSLFVDLAMIKQLDLAGPVYFIVLGDGEYDLGSESWLSFFFVEGSLQGVVTMSRRGSQSMSRNRTWKPFVSTSEALMNPNNYGPQIGSSCP